MQTQTTETPALTLDSADLSISDYRALREGREVPKAIVEADSAAEAANADAETAVAAESTETTNEEPKEDPKPKKGERVSGRISELTAQIRDLKSQLAAKGGAVEAPKIEPKAAVETPTIPPDPNDPEPVAEKFDNYVEWQKAWNRWDRRQENRANEAARVAADRQTAAAAKASTWQEQVTKASEEIADFAEVAQNPDLPVTAAMGEAILTSEIGTKILYHLGQNPAEAARIAKLSDVAQVREIGKLEATLAKASAEETPTAPQVKKTPVSKAPAPLKPVAGGASSANPAKNFDSMSQAEYRALREAGKIR